MIVVIFGFTECADKKMMRIRHFLYEGLAVSEAVSGLDASVLSSYIAVRAGTLPAGVSIAGITGMLESDRQYAEAVSGLQGRK